jgi:8-oxo-dGTP diphosphatase
MNEAKNVTSIVVKTICKTIVTNPQGEVLLLRRSSTHPTRAHAWDIPGGIWDGPQESFEQTIIREVREETGLSINNCRLLMALPVVLDDAKTALALGFACMSLPGDITLSYEHDEYVWTALSVIEKYSSLPPQWKSLFELYSAQKNTSG